jgi:hypothetical protein
MMKTIKFGSAILAVAAAGLIALAPLQAQRSSVEPGNYVSVAYIKTLDGHAEEYMDWLKTKWQAERNWAKSKGYEIDYRILQNLNPRANEPDLDLVITFKDWPSNAEAKKRRDELVAQMKMDEHAMDSASGDRSKWRTLMGSALFQELIFTK